MEINASRQGMTLNHVNLRYQATIWNEFEIRKSLKNSASRLLSCYPAVQALFWNETHDKPVFRCCHLDCNECLTGRGLGAEAGWGWGTWTVSPLHAHSRDIFFFSPQSSTAINPRWQPNMKICVPRKRLLCGLLSCQLLVHIPA